MASPFRAIAPLTTMASPTSSACSNRTMRSGDHHIDQHDADNDLTVPTVRGKVLVELGLVLVARQHGRPGGEPAQFGTQRRLDMRADGSRGRDEDSVDQARCRMRAEHIAGPVSSAKPKPRR
jgi:hypothetical protein